MQTPKRTPYGYAPKPSSNGRLSFVGKLSPLDRKHIKQWYAMGFSRTSIARAYDISYGYVAQIVRGQERNADTS